ncbi:uncharacterized protein LOC115212122 [Octopus sinensis]|uniref:Uncharacterized protein LOC115212122 n=1 Tax=Octopus sinensis TaxID=2607531 RepID=A0A6P7SFT7_9MOLL|nr:uncharacterized protein LOC115212122 [Octopus sinensis]
MDKIWHHGIIKYLQEKGLAPKDIHADVVATLGADAPALSIVKKWAGRESIKDDPRSRCPATATTQENIDHVQHMVMDDRRLNIDHIANAVGSSHKQVENILHDELMSKISTTFHT